VEPDEESEINGLACTCRCRVGNFPQFVWRRAHWAVDVRLTRNNMVAGVDVTRLDISPNPAPMAAELNLEVRARPHRLSASSAPVQLSATL